MKEMYFGSLQHAGINLEGNEMLSWGGGALCKFGYNDDDDDEEHSEKDDTDQSYNFVSG